ncbi:GFA family protein [Arhodomonas sp. AD133]|uniref:GFA family protein n=1 Tax=Arhodomonas sp. AD133 TaxID=3415009 RepID=UPI003EBEEC8E
MKRTYKGSCHCGTVRYEADVDLAAGTLKCNCSICAKARSWLAMVPADAFRLLAGDEVLITYQFGSRHIHHLFCRRCGIRPFGWGEDTGTGTRAYAINLACLDDVDAAELASAPVSYVDGRHDNWTSPPAETRHL